MLLILSCKFGEINFPLRHKTQIGLLQNIQTFSMSSESLVYFQFMSCFQEIFIEHLLWWLLLYLQERQISCLLVNFEMAFCYVPHSVLFTEAVSIKCWASKPFSFQLVFLSVCKKFFQQLVKQKSRFFALKECLGPCQTSGAFFR